MNNALMPHADLFRDEYYASKVWQNTRWLGVRVLKSPLDLWRYQELIVELRPDILVETGTYEGGSALFFATIMDSIEHGHIITVDISPKAQINHRRITQLCADSVLNFKQIKNKIPSDSSVMVVLDSSHDPKHVTQELELYSNLVTIGQPLVLEDTFSYKLGNKINHLEKDVIPTFLETHKNFKTLDEKFKFGATFNPNGWIVKI